MHVFDLPVQGVVSVCINLVDVNCIIVPSDCKVLVIWRVFHGLTPFSRIFQDSDDLLEVVVVKNCDITIVITNSYVTMES
jgi:hypothetical protein